jgi:hypothetical protein
MAVEEQNLVEETRRTMRRRRPFCWRQCPYNLWRQQQIEWPCGEKLQEAVS